MKNIDIVRLALDVYHGTAVAPAEFAEKRPVEVLREALIELNGGSAKFDYKNFRRNKTEMFEIIEEIVPILVNEGLQGDEFFMNLVEERNLAAGDRNEFITEDNSLFVVAEMADGVAIPRRQRIGESTSVNVRTALHGVRIYEELNRFLAGRIDWNACIDKIAASYKAEKLDTIYAVFTGITAQTPGLNDTYVTGGTYDEETILKLVDHVEAATGKSATIYGTKAALRKCSTAVMSDSAKDDYYRMGFFGKLAGIPMVSVKNRHAVGTDAFIFPDDKLFIMASDDRPIKVVNEGEAYILEKEPANNSDLTMEYLYTEKYGVSLMVADKMGIYTIS